MRRACKVDVTQASIVKALREAGATVQDLSAVGRGVPDLLVGYNTVNYLIECKSPGGKLTPVQSVFHSQWNGNVRVAYTPDEAIRIIKP